MPWYRYLWKTWAKALGAKEGGTNREADHVALWRTALILLGLGMNLVITLSAAKNLGWIG